MDNKEAVEIKALLKTMTFSCTLGSDIPVFTEPPPGRPVGRAGLTSGLSSAQLVFIIINTLCTKVTSVGDFPSPFN